jgi:hypothetical protein
VCSDELFVALLNEAGWVALIDRCLREVARPLFHEVCVIAGFFVKREHLHATVPDLLVTLATGREGALNPDYIVEFCRFLPERLRVSDFPKVHKALARLVSGGRLPHDGDTGGRLCRPLIRLIRENAVSRDVTSKLTWDDRALLRFMQDVNQYESCQDFVEYVALVGAAQPAWTAQMIGSICERFKCNLQQHRSCHFCLAVLGQWLVIEGSKNPTQLQQIHNAFVKSQPVNSLAATSELFKFYTQNLVGDWAMDFVIRLFRGFNRMMKQCEEDFFTTFFERLSDDWASEVIGKVCEQLAPYKKAILLKSYAAIRVCFLASVWPGKRREIAAHISKQISETWPSGAPEFQEIRTLVDAPFDDGVGRVVVWDT